MSIKSTEIKMYKDKYYCDDCLDTELNFTGRTLMSYPPKFIHFCSKCNKEYALNDQYPVIKHYEIN